MKICLTGTHSTGKTTLAEKISNKFDLKLITGITRKLHQEEGYKLNRNSGDFESNMFQIRLMEEHEKILQSKDNVVVDRGMFDVFSYTIYFHKTGQINYKTLIHNMIYVLKYYNSYDFIIYTPLNENCKIYDDGFRDLDVNFQFEINSIINDLLKSFRPKYYICVQTDWNLRDKEVMEEIEKLLLKSY